MLANVFTVGPSPGSIHRIFTWFGASDSFATSAQSMLVGPLRILTIVVVAFAITRLVPRLSRRLVRSLQLRTPLRLTSARADGRAATITGVFASAFRAIVWLIAGLTILGVLGIDLAPFVATATVIGAAVGFGAQSLVKDFLSGVLILAEDQYGVGDSITVGDLTGTVESLNLRTTRLRSLDGMVWFVPNGEIRKVGNSSEGYGQAVADIVVPPGTDLPRATRLAEEEANAMAADAEWRDVVLESPVVMGVQTMDAEGVTIRVVCKTATGSNLSAARALRIRVSERLRTEGVAWAKAPSPDGAKRNSRNT
jgi:small-conductance mechanosensitive channel